MITIVDSFGKAYDGNITIECGRDKITGEGTTMSIDLSPLQVTVNNNGSSWPKKKDGTYNIAANELIGSVDIQSIKNCSVGHKDKKGQWPISPTADEFTLQITLNCADPTATVTIGEPLPPISDKKKEKKNSDGTESVQR